MIDKILQVNSSGAVNVYPTTADLVFFDDGSDKALDAIITSINNSINSHTSLINSLQSQINNMPNKIYPVGSIYMSRTSTDPYYLFGGSWTRISGRFLFASDSAGAAGGNQVISLSYDQLPSHSHGFSVNGYTSQETAAHTHDFSYQTLNVAVTSWLDYIDNNGQSIPHGAAINGLANNYGVGYSTTGGQKANHQHTFSYSGNTGNSGGSGAINIMPPYYTVFCWYRYA